MAEGYRKVKDQKLRIPQSIVVGSDVSQYGVTFF